MAKGEAPATGWPSSSNCWKIITKNRKFDFCSRFLGATAIQTSANLAYETYDALKRPARNSTALQEVNLRSTINSFEAFINWV